MKLNFKQKVLFFLFPLVCALFLSLIMVNNIFNKKQYLLSVEDNLNEIKYESTLIHFLQMERGLSTIFVSQQNKNTTTNEMLISMRREVDKILNFTILQSIDNSYNQLISTRKDIDSGALSAINIIDAYASLIILYQNHVKSIFASMQYSEINNLIRAYDYLLTAKESLAKIRGVVNKGLMQTMDPDIIKRIFSYRESFFKNMDDFTVIVSPEIIEFYTSSLTHEEVKTTFNIIDNILQNDSSLVSDDIWFTNISYVINNLYNIEQKLFNQTHQTIDFEQKSLDVQVHFFFLFIFIIIFIIFFLSKNIIQSTRKLEKSYETSQQLLQQYKDAIDKSFIVSKTDKAGIITYVNEQFCEISGYAIHELIGKSHNIIKHPDTLKETFQELWKTTQKGKRWHGVIKNRKKDGSAYWLDEYIHPIIDLKGNITEYISIRHDVTPFYIMKGNLFKSLKTSHTNLNQVTHLSKQYENVINESNSVIRVDLNGKILFVNNRFCEISGYTQEEILGLDFFTTYTDDMEKETVHEMWTTIKNGTIWRGILKNKRKDGTPYWVKATVVPIKNKKGDIIEFMSIRNDITTVIRLQEEIEATQQEVIYHIGEIAECRSNETGNHVKRVAEYSRLLALKYGINPKEANLIADASPMHDIGKVGIPDYILHKEGKLTEHEWEIMQTHVTLGYNVFKNSTHPLLKTAALIALEHHEKYNGTGYPQKLQGENIHIYARIVAIADVFDALSHDRCYKKAWDDDVIFEFFEKEKGEHFDPQLTNIFLQYKEKFLNIKNQLRDS